MKPFFKLEDFDEYQLVGYSQISKKANQIIEQRGTIVFRGPKSVVWGPNKAVQDTHQAILINIEEIPHKMCDHQCGQITFYAGKQWVESTCATCGKNIKPSGWTTI